MAKDNRGRPKEIEAIKLMVYTQIFKHEDGSVHTWYWDKNRHLNGPYLVEIEEFIDPELEKLIKQRNKIIASYETPPGERKKRITKEDKLKLEELNGKIEETQI